MRNNITRSSGSSKTARVCRPYIACTTPGCKVWYHFDTKTYTTCSACKAPFPVPGQADVAAQHDAMQAGLISSLAFYDEPRFAGLPQMQLMKTMTLKLIE